MEKKWIIEKRINWEGDAISKNYHPVLLQLLKNRGIEKKEDIELFLNFDYQKGLIDPWLFSDMSKAVDRIMEAKGRNEKIAVYGDYDADGVLATIVILEALEKVGVTNLIPYIPDRQLEGYGLNEEAINYLKKEKVNLIITVDCGITNSQEIEQAKKLGMDVIVTDHHHVPPNLPRALALINPHIQGQKYSFTELAGVGVAFKLAQALYKRTCPEEIEQLKWLLDLVAIGTIADCAILKGENLVLTKYGLIVLSKTKRIGLQEIFKVGRIQVDEDNVPDAKKVSFQIAPRINAAGRMDHANVSLKLITEKNKIKARDLALELESCNQARQKITEEIVREIRILANKNFKAKPLIFVQSDHWPIGILGLVAGKIAEEFGKPTAVFRKQSVELVGSFRSIAQLNIIEAIEKCSEYLIKYGGHAQAAGARVKIENIEKFYRKLNSNIEKIMVDRKIIPEIRADLILKAQEIDWELLLNVKKMEPFGEGNPEPIFLTEGVLVEEVRVVGNTSRHLKIMLRDSQNGPKLLEAVGFGMGERISSLKQGDKINILFNLSEDRWNGNSKIQLKLVDFKKSKM